MTCQRNSGIPMNAMPSKEIMFFLKKDTLPLWIISLSSSGSMGKTNFNV